MDVWSSLFAGVGVGDTAANTSVIVLDSPFLSTSYVDDISDSETVTDAVVFDVGSQIHCAVVTLTPMSIMNDKETVNCINSFFVGLTKDFPVVQDKWLINNEMESLPTVSRESVAKRLKELKTNKSSGLNDPNVKILKTFADFFAIPLADIFNESFKVFPCHLERFCGVTYTKSNTLFRC